MEILVDVAIASAYTLHIFDMKKILNINNRMTLGILS